MSENFYRSKDFYEFVYSHAYRLVTTKHVNLNTEEGRYTKFDGSWNFYRSVGSPASATGVPDEVVAKALAWSMIEALRIHEADIVRSGYPLGVVLEQIARHLAVGGWVMNYKQKMR